MKSITSRLDDKSFFERDDQGPESQVILAAFEMMFRGGISSAGPELFRTSEASITSRAGYDKIVQAVMKASANDLNYIWIDTCCT
ncbi:hypothetical protein K469DRAFT_705718 [Zopfia rhizophila CBS 207.26]|uniref:Heterokaryon incompatibility domain-containing protein n=1 Tax=Zopfia rhizophila CBS 207.26 TaxID=1314779 RepID=A0A6A6E5G6_9PEZI|nr:hypothetical protein K469DRAFT_705718 [Zopfia rhizophila CBS 207.26]